MPRGYIVVGVLGAVMLLIGSYIGLFMAPPERHMGDVARILYIHVPTAWSAMLVLTAAFVFGVLSLITSKPKWDAAMTGSVEAGVVLGALLCFQGAIWAKPTWGVWWDWDVRLTTSLIMVLLYAGILALRSFVEDAERRATWSAVAVIVAYVDVPLVYFCVRWWRSLHQVQSSPETVDSQMILPLRINAFAVIFISIWFIAQRAYIELARRRREAVAMPARRERRDGVAHA
jgi:heme exporter protein C